MRKRTRSGRLCRVGWSFCCVVAAVLHRVITVGSAHVVLESGSAFGTSNCRTAAFRRQVGLFELSLSLRIRQRMQSKGKEAFARGSSTHTTRRGTVARAPRGGPRTSQHGPGSISLGEAASPPRKNGGVGDRWSVMQKPNGSALGSCTSSINERSRAATRGSSAAASSSKPQDSGHGESRCTARRVGAWLMDTHKPNN